MLSPLAVQVSLTTLRGSSSSRSRMNFVCADDLHLSTQGTRFPRRSSASATRNPASSLPSASHPTCPALFRQIYKRTQLQANETVDRHTDVVLRGKENWSE